MSRILIESRDGEPSRHRSLFKMLLAKSGGVVKIASPYVTEDELPSSQPWNQAQLLTTLSASDIACRATSIPALARLVKSGVDVRALDESQRLHAKVYIFGERDAIVTSANFTKNGLDSNLEVGSHIQGQNVAQLSRWFISLFNGAKRLNSDVLAALEEEASTVDVSTYIDSNVAKLRGRISGLLAPDSSTMDLKDILDQAERFFVCNTNRRRSNSYAYDQTHKLERAMYAARCAAIWPYCNYEQHMKSVGKGDVIYMYASKTGLVGLGCARGGYDPLPLNHTRAIRKFSEADLSRSRRKSEWQVSVDWIVWNAENPLPWPREICRAMNASFIDITANKHRSLRDRLGEQYLTLMQMQKAPPTTTS